MAEAPISDTDTSASSFWRPLDWKEPFWNLTRGGRGRRRSRQGDYSPTSFTRTSSELD